MHLDLSIFLSIMTNSSEPAKEKHLWQHDAETIMFHCMSGVFRVKY